MKRIFAITLGILTLLLAYVLSGGHWEVLERQPWHPAFSIFFAAVIIVYAAMYTPDILQWIQDRKRQSRWWHESEK